MRVWACGGGRASLLHGGKRWPTPGAFVDQAGLHLTCPLLAWVLAFGELQ